MDLVIHLNPTSVLDIGVGFGKYGVLCREYLELWDERGEYTNFTHRIDGIEAFPEYLTPIHQTVYNQVYIGNASQIIQDLPLSYDLVLLIDVLEHFEKQEGEQLVKNLLRKNQSILISVPKNIGNQGDVFHNPYEIHRSKWRIPEILELANTPVSFILPDLRSNIVFISNQSEHSKLKAIFNPTLPIQMKRMIQELFLKR